MKTLLILTTLSLSLLVGTAGACDILHCVSGCENEKKTYTNEEMMKIWNESNRVNCSSHFYFDNPPYWCAYLPEPENQKFYLQVFNKQYQCKEWVEVEE